ncbi:hypothetical protein ACF0H5_002219 [Mactra antiquata]
MSPSDRTPVLKEVKVTRLEPSIRRQTVMLLACAYLHFTSLGFASVLGVAYVELLRHFQCNRSEAAVVQSIFSGLVNIGGIIFSRVVTKHGIGIPVMIASLIGSASMFFSTFSINIYMVISLVGVVCGLSMSINYLSGFVAVGWTFFSSRRAALSFLTMATAVGQAFLPNVADALISEYSWTGLFIISAGIMLNGIPCGLVLHLSKTYFYKEQPSTSSDAKVCQFQSKLDVAFILLVILCTIFSGTAAVESWFIVDLSVLRGFSRQAGTLLLSLVGAFGLGGRLIGTIILKLYPNIRIAVPMTIACIGLGAAHMVVILFTNYYGMMVGVVMRGLSIGLVKASIQPMQLELRGLEAFPQTVALCNVLTGCGLALCGYILGSIADWTGGYELPFYIATGFAVLDAITVAIIRCLQ